MRVITTVLKNLLHICKPFLNDIKVKDLRSRYSNKKAFSDVRRYVLKHIKNLNIVLLNFKLVKCTIFKEKSQFCMSRIKIIKFICDFSNRRFKSSKVIKILK